MATMPTKETRNAVDQNKILVETIKKELRHQKLHTNYSINPFRKYHTLTGKVNSIYDTADGEEDAHFLQVIKRANLEPVKKYPFPQTESQEIGWITQPLVANDRSDKRLQFFRCNSEITKFMEAAWLMKEQTN